MAAINFSGDSGKPPRDTLKREAVKALCAGFSDDRCLAHTTVSADNKTDLCDALCAHRAVLHGEDPSLSYLILNDGNVDSERGRPGIESGHVAQANAEISDGEWGCR